MRSEFVLSHTLTIKEGDLPGVLSFFDLRTEGNSPRITSSPEAPLVRLLFEEERYRNLLLKELGVEPEVIWELEQKRPILPAGWKSKPGDVDILLLPTDPRLSTAIEAKRYKVTLTPDGELAGSGLEDLIAKGAEQLRGLLSIGFHRVVFMILIPTDGAARQGGNALDHGPSDALFNQILNEINKRQLPEEAGVLIVTVEQPAEASFATLGKVTACLTRAPKAREQAIDLTERIVNALNLGWGIRAPKV